MGLNASISEADRLKLKSFINQLSRFRGRHTELVSVYIPQGYSLNKVLEHLSQEQGTASNIKSATTRKNVIAALEKMIQHLKLFKETPPNGLAVFSGNVSEREGRPDIQVWSIEPPIPLKQRVYRCDKYFVLEPLKQMLVDKASYGLLIVERKEADFGLLQGKSIIHLEHKKSAVPGKTRAGGQCLSPLTKVLTPSGAAMLKSLQIGDVVLGFDFEKQRVCKAVITDYWSVTKQETLLIKIGRQGFTIEASPDHLFFVLKKNSAGKEKLFRQLPAEKLKKGLKVLVRVNNKNKVEEITSIDSVVGVRQLVDISTSSNNFFANHVLVHNSAQRFERVREGLLKDFFKEIGEAAKKHFSDKNLKGIIIGGPGPTKNLFLDGDYLPSDLKQKVVAVKDIGYAGEYGLHELVERSADVLANEAIIEEKQVLRKFFTMLAKNPKLTAYGYNEVKQKLLSSSVETLILSEDVDESIIKELSAIAEEYATKVFIASNKTREGVQLKNIGGIAAILRF